VAEIADIHQASQCTYGALRVHGQLRHRGHRVGRKRVARLMAAEGLVGVHGRRKWRRGRPNTAPAPDQRWVEDITEFACSDGTLYPAGIKDLCDQSIVGWSMGVRQTTDLVVNALVMALGRRHPDADLLHHADRGPQYTSLEFSTRPRRLGHRPVVFKDRELYRLR
jgi:putative transposase